MQTQRVSRRNGLTRQHYVNKHGWFILQNYQVHLLAKLIGKSKTVEIGAGLGELATKVRKQLTLLNGWSRNYTAFDNFEWGYKGSGVVKKDLKDVRIHKADFVVLCWPAYDEPMAYTVANRMRKGQVLIYQGEGDGGCNGCDDFHDLLHDKFERSLQLWEDALNDGHKQWDGINDYWWIYRKVK